MGVSLLELSHAKEIPRLGFHLGSGGPETTLAWNAGEELWNFPQRPCGNVAWENARLPLVKVLTSTNAEPAPETFFSGPSLALGSC